VKTVGELLAAFFDKNMAEKAQGYSDLFSCWSAITEKNGISSAAAHSRIVELERAVLLVEADHPGWIQILQTKQAQVLNAVIRRFPDLEIRGISFRLSREPFSVSAGTSVSGPAPSESIGRPGDSFESTVKAAGVPASGAETSDPVTEDGKRDYFDRIEDKEFLETLKRLEKLERRSRKKE
jgi:hypothetical protein